MLENLREKKILILGFGKEGRDTYFGLRKLFPNKFLGIADQNKFSIFNFQFSKLLKNDKNVKLHFGKNYLDKIGEYDVIIKTPGISFKELGSLKGKEPSFLTSQTEIFFDNFPGLIVGVTGTKGKGTTATLIYEILKKAGLPVYLGGNIGHPVLQKLVALRPAQGENCVFIYELSSHQLQGLKKSPQIAVFLNLFEDHLDYYKNFAEYQKAKANIAKHQTKNDYLIYNSSDQKVREIASKSKAVKIPISSKPLLTLFERSLQKCYQLKGDFNFLNLRAAVKVAELFKVPDKVILQAVKDFKGLPHRLEFVGKYKGIEFYNNSMATIPAVTIQDLKTFNNKPISLIVGGSDKGSDYTELVKEIKRTSVKNLIILGQGTGEKIVKVLGEEKWRRSDLPRTELKLSGGLTSSIFLANTMKEAVKVCFEKTPKNGVCLLSPASASFNMFKDYQDRGNQFKKFVKLYGKE